MRYFEPFPFQKGINHKPFVFSKFKAETFRKAEITKCVE